MRKFKSPISRICIYTCFFLFLLNIPLFPFDTGDLQQEYLQKFEKAEQLRQAGEFEKSLDLFNQSLSIATKIKDETKQCESLYKMGILYWNLGKPNDSQRYFEQAKFLAEKLKTEKILHLSKTALEIYLLYNQGKDFRYSSEFEESIKSFQTAISLAQEIGSQEHELKCLRQMSYAHQDNNQLIEFKNANIKALEIARRLNHKIEQGRCLINIGNYYEQINNYSEALNQYKQALEITYIKKDKSICLNNIGIIYQNLGVYEKALEYLNRALVINKELNDDYSISKVLNNIGAAHRTRGLTYDTQGDILQAQDFYYKALNSFRESLKLAEKNKDPETQVEVLNNIGTIYSDLERYSEALKYFQMSYEKAEEISNYEGMGMTLTNIGIVHYYLDNFEESAKCYEKAINLAIQIEGGQILWEAYLEIAKAYEKQGKINDAINNYMASIETTEKIRSKIILEELKARFLGTDKRIEAYHRLIHLLVSQRQSESRKKYNEDAFNYLERAKARAFLDSMELSQVDLSHGIDAELLNKEKELMKDITNIYSKLLAAELSSDEKTSLSTNLKVLEDKLETLKREIRKESPAYANLKYPEIITLDETQKKLLDNKTAVFAYSLGQENSYAFIITKKELKIFPLPTRNHIRKKVSDYLRVITDKDNHSFQAGNELFNSLILPGLEGDIENIIFIPDAILHFLPFEALVSNNEKNRWLVEDYTIAYAPSISSLREIIDRKNTNKRKPRMDLLAFGDPHFGALEKEENGGDIFKDFFSSRSFDFYRLEYSGIEIDEISSLFKKGKRNIFRRQEASEEQLKNHKLDEYRIIHFATHSIIDERRPYRSSIVLTLDKDTPEDGFLQMREIYALKFNSDLVTLSSCQTGLGEFIHAEGIEGINRAFFYAGSSSVLMSLWVINDQASYQLMERFYFHLRSSESIMDALRKAKLELIESGVLSHPYYWAGFIASGQTDEVIFPRSGSNWIYFGIFFLIVFGGFLVLRKRFTKNA